MIKTTTIMLATLSMFQIFNSVNDFHRTLPVPVLLNEEDKMITTRLALIEAKAPLQRLETLTRSCYYAGQATNIDPILVASIISPESDYLITAKSKKGYKGLMQRPKARMKWDFVETDIMDGACCLREKLTISKNNLPLAMALYKGGTSQKAKNIAKKQLEIYHDIKSKVNEK